MNKLWITALVGAVLSLDAAAQQATAPQSSAPEFELHDAWVRALPPTQANTAAYMTVTNRGESSITITGGSAPVARLVEIHTTREIDGYMRMEKLSELVVPPGQSVELAPGGNHLMLLDLSRMPAPGETITVCLQTATGASQCTDAPVRKSAAGKQSHDTHQHHH